VHQGNYAFCTPVLHYIVQLSNPLDIKKKKIFLTFKKNPIFKKISDIQNILDFKKKKIPNFQKNYKFSKINFFLNFEFLENFGF
jgi:inorganic pyrophosphatase